MEDDETTQEGPEEGVLRYLRIPVRDPWASRDWYSDVFDFDAVLDLEWESGVVGVLLRHDPGWFVALHQDAERARALRGFVLFGLTAGGVERLHEWDERLTAMGIRHGAITEGHLGLFLDVEDPDGIVVRIHAGTQPYAEDA